MANVPDPVLSWSFDETSGTTATSKPGGEVITLDRAAFVPGRSGSAILFDANKGAHNVTTTIPSRKPPYTVVLWVRRDAETSNSTLLSGPDTAFKLEQYQWPPPPPHYVGMTQYSYGTGDGFDADFGVSIPVGQWTHLGLVADGTDTKLYVNGTLQGTVQKSIELQMHWLGSSRDGAEFAQMTLDELKIYDVALNPDQIQQTFGGNQILTVAGNGVKGFGGDTGQATAAQLGFCCGAVVDHAGNLCIVDSGNNRVRKVDPQGVITTIAGTGAVGFSGDGHQAAAAQLTGPWGIAVDSTGNLFIADCYNHRVRKIDRQGTITTVAGSGVMGFGGDSGAATAAQLHAPVAVAVDSRGNLFIADWENQRVRKVDPSGIITTVAGVGQAGFSGDSGPATAAQLNFPSAVAVDSTGNLFIADKTNNRVRRVDAQGVITTVAGTGAAAFGGDDGPALAAQLSDPWGVAVDSAGNLFIADTKNNRVRKVDAHGVITTVAGTGAAAFGGDGGPAPAAQLNSPYAMAIDSTGNLFIVDAANYRVRSCRL